MKINQLIMTVIVLFALSSCNCSTKSKKTCDKETTCCSEETACCDKATSTETSAIISPLEGFFTKNTVAFENDYKYVVVTNKASFDTNFGIAKTMNNTVAKIDFDKNNVAAIMTKPSSVQKTIVITKHCVKENEMTIVYQIKNQDEQSFTSGGLNIFEIPKTIKSIKFVSGEQSEQVLIK